jgi:exopolysaccharide biosynthesis polyprenyl glycosylphosphotransferase
LLVSDVLSLLASLGLVEWVFGADGPQGTLGGRAEPTALVASLPVWVAVASLYGLYRHDETYPNHSTADDVIGVFHMVTVCVWLVYVVTLVTGLARPEPAKLVAFWLLAVLLVSGGRALTRGAARRSRLSPERALVVGAGEVGQRIARKLQQHPEYGVEVVGLVDDGTGKRADGAVPVLGGIEQIRALLTAYAIERVVVSFPSADDRRVLELIRAIDRLGINIDIVPRLFEVVSPTADLHNVEGVPLISLHRPGLSPSGRFVKRAADLSLAGLGLVLLLPLFAVVVAAIKLDSPGPVLFRQIRIGRYGRPFRIAKFRTMVADAELRKAELAHLNKYVHVDGDGRMFKIVGDPRITRVGRFLRRYSIDELPQLLNVIAGDMSLVGPRPLIAEEDSHITSWARARLDLRPGITGPWQVQGRNDIPFDEMIVLDYHYVTRWSPAEDLRLLLRTIPAAHGPRAA